MEIKPGYKLTEVGVIPEDWIVQPLAHVASLEVGYAFKSSWYRKHSGVPLLRGENVGYGRLDWSDTRRLPEKDAKPFSAYLLRPGDIVIGMDRTFTKSGTKISLLQEGDCPCLLVQRVGKFVPLTCNASFLWALLSSTQFQLSLQLEQKGMDIPHLSRSEILQPYVALPPTSTEQEEIATTLSDMDELLEALDRLIAKKRNLKQTAMQQLLTGKTRLPVFGEGKGYKQTEVGEIPEDWDIRPLKVISTMSGRIGWQGLKQEEFTANDTDPFLITGMNFKEGKIRWNEVYHIPEARYQEDKNIQLKDGDILMTKDGTIGKILYVEDIPFPGKASLNSHLLVFRPVNGAYDPKFLFYQLSSKQFSDYVDLNKSGSTFFGITQEAVGNYRAYLPSLPEQIAIATILSDIDAEIAALEQRRDKTRALKQAMMQELLTGRIRLV